MRYPTPAVRRLINDRFKLPDDDNYQDRPLEVSDQVRVEEFLNAYEREPWSDDERYALMELILFSYEERLMLDVELNRALRNRLRGTLLQAFELHRPTVEYWCCFPEDPADWDVEEYQFPVTPLAREVWAEMVKDP